MINVDELRGAIARKGISQRQLAKRLGLSEKTFYSKMKSGVFRSDEIEKMIILLDIKDPVSIFFSRIGTGYAPNVNDSLINL